MNRRELLVTLTCLSGVVGTGADGEGGQRPARRMRRRVRRRVRRRIRRRIARRIVRGRTVWVVPVGLAVGWELVRDNEVVMVTTTRFVERDGARVEIATVRDGRGRTEDLEIVRENTDENRVELQGSAIPEGDSETPGIESEEDVEVEEPE